MYLCLSGRIKRTPYGTHAQSAALNGPGSAGTKRLLKEVKENEELAFKPSAESYLIHGTSNSSFGTIYCLGVKKIKGLACNEYAAKTYH